MKKIVIALGVALGVILPIAAIMVCLSVFKPAVSDKQLSQSEFIKKMFPDGIKHCTSVYGPSDLTWRTTEVFLNKDRDVQIERDTSDNGSQTFIADYQGNLKSDSSFSRFQGSYGWQRGDPEFYKSEEAFQIRVNDFVTNRYKYRCQ